MNAFLIIVFTLVLVGLGVYSILKTSARAERDMSRILEEERKRREGEA